MTRDPFDEAGDPALEPAPEAPGSVSTTSTPPEQSPAPAPEPSPAPAPEIAGDPAWKDHDPDFRVARMERG
jgi:hypothetical protein